MAFLQDPGTYLYLGSMNMFHEVASQLYDTIESRHTAFITDNVTPDFEMYDPSSTPPLCPTKCVPPDEYPGACRAPDFPPAPIIS
ncbi:uncharacterized protein RSE6_15198 [Rhynchosporium secalis]|uniref:Uncharacterized protein n=1 Tax=Rhynchosporium secalis TaxID=38038 RepID=A0A1E1MWT8_RHYSE|nr:uncharacterized protein RSE6_15198 [Rhynchosporium secalis]